jgi:uncharacterized protein DUF4158/Tn3 transposase DDE domain-containing protein
MPRRSILSAAEHERLLALPHDPADLIRLYTLSEHDLSVIRQRRGAANRLGFAVQLCYMRHPGVILGPDQPPFAPLLRLVAMQLKVSPACWAQYGQRVQTRREHLVELQSVFGFRSFAVRHHRAAVQGLEPVARQTDKGIVLASALVDDLRRQSILLPSVNVIERLCAEAITGATRRLYAVLTQRLTPTHHDHLDALLHVRAGSTVSTLVWLRQPPGAPTAKHVLEHIGRLRTIDAFALPARVEHEVHQNRLLKLAREGGQMTAQHVRELEPTRRYATLVAVVLEARATVIDEVIDLNDRILGTLFNRARRHHEEHFQEAAKAINEKVRLFYRVGQALVKARRDGGDPFQAIEAVISWEAFTRSVTEAESLAQSEDFDYLYRIGESYSQIRRHAPAFLDVIQMKATPAATDILLAVETLKSLNADHTRKVPLDAPTSFVRKRWERLVFTAAGVDRRFYELCTLAELKNALRSGDIWVEGSRQFKDFDEYLVPTETCAALTQAGTLPLKVSSDCDVFLRERQQLLEQQLTTVNRRAIADALPDAIITEAGLKITPLTNAVPEDVDTLTQQAYGLLPHVKITELLMDVDEWTDFSRHFTHLKTGEPAKEKTLLLTAILADGINLGLSKMAESCPGTTYATLSWLHAWHVRDETYAAALADLVNAQFRHPFAEQWGDGTASSSDGQRFKTGGRAEARGHINPKYGSEPSSSTPTSPTSTRRSTPRSSTSACAMPPTCSTACYITNPTSALRSITPIRPASRTTSSR